jgi:hypothetical protein
MFWWRQISKGEVIAIKIIIIHIGDQLAGVGEKAAISFQ